MSEDNQQVESNNPNQLALFWKPEDQPKKIITEKTKQPTPNRAELLARLENIFNEAREDRRSYRTLRNSFSGAAGLLGAMFNNIFNNIQSTSDVAFSATVLGLLAYMALYSNKFYNNRMARAIETGRMAQNLIKEAVDSKKDFFEGKYFVTYLELYYKAKEKVEESEKNPEQNLESAVDTRSEETKLTSYALFGIFGALYLSMLWQWILPHEGQHVVIEKTPTGQRIIIDNLPKSVLNSENTCKPPFHIKGKISKKNEINLELNCAQPEQFP
ncbi:MAG: hypothetical protein DYH13_04610 [Alphaproteobacteria bacterium PRO2]|nr:hypothetical protein [Alphaproteobacteria bacterium PRO2]